MADSQPHPDTFTWPFQLTKALYRDVYPAVDPANPQLSAEGKTVLITGGGGAVGAEIAKAWAIAHVDQIILVGRSAASLKATESELHTKHPELKVTVKTADTREEDSIKGLFESLVSEDITVNVVIDAAGATNNAVTGTIEPSNWWNDFETNVKGPYLLSHYMMATYGDKNATFIIMGSNATAIIVPGMSSYACSKLAATRMLEFLQAEHTDMRFFALSPGNVASRLTNPNFLPFAKDTGLLAGGWTLYLATEQADYMKGGFLNVNWDVVEMEKHKHEIEGKGLLRLGFIKAELGPTGHPFEATL